MTPSKLARKKLTKQTWNTPPHSYFQNRARARYQCSSVARFSFILTRDADDPQRQPCIIHLDPVEDGFGRGILLHYREPNELRPFQLHPDQLPAKPLAREVSASDPCSKQLSPGDSVSWELHLPSVYFDCFIVDQSYEILWPGAQIHLLASTITRFMSLDIDLSPYQSV
jgi:hypothetical protein